MASRVSFRRSLLEPDIAVVCGRVHPFGEDLEKRFTLTVDLASVFVFAFAEQSACARTRVFCRTARD